MPIKPSTGYVARAVPSFYSDLADISNNDPEFIKAVKLASRSYNELENLQDPSSCSPKKSRGAGAGCKVKAPEVRVALLAIPLVCRCKRIIKGMLTSPFV